eukprot:CAMPEP_0116883218 /NCGR_PEP_ID=MMETSP0463-20121206/15687_1 /TAXON_ID=181622 /ORGANISM="Strombidinopsis sp, Strain SopsisLIS2011" /LENGTH=124 /DNA_ID=CAMNT_0004537657 /DNA_START=127 /DNA_END=501 /DNA_ORIENTATION=-
MDGRFEFMLGFCCTTDESCGQSHCIRGKCNTVCPDINSWETNRDLNQCCDYGLQCESARCTQNICMEWIDDDPDRIYDEDEAEQLIEGLGLVVQSSIVESIEDARDSLAEDLQDYIDDYADDID